MKKPNHVLMYRILLVIEGHTLRSLQTMRALYDYDEIDLKRCVRFLEDKRMIRVDAINLTCHVTEAGHEFAEEAKQAGIWTPEIEKKPASTHVIEEKPAADQIKEIFESLTQENGSGGQYSPQFSQGKIGKSEHELMCKILLVIEGRTLFSLRALPALYDYDEFDLKRCVRFLKEKSLISLDASNLTHHVTEVGYGFLEGAKQAGSLTQEMESIAENRSEETQGERRVREERESAGVVTGFFGEIIGTFFRILFLRFLFGMFS